MEVANDPRAPKEVAFLIRDYNKRKALAELGYTSDYSKLPAWKAEAFFAIAVEQSKPKKPKKGPKGG